jgi:hypothetical protein
MLFLPKCAVGVTSLAAGAGGRRPLHCVRVRELKGGDFRLDATDGRALGIVRGPSLPSPTDLAAARALPAPSSLAFESLVGARELARAMRQLGAEGRLAVLLGSREVVLSAGGTVSHCPAEDERFVDTDSVLPTTPAPVSFRVDPRLLIAALKAALAIAESGGEGGVPAVELLWWGNGRPVGVTALGAGGVSFDGLVMPLV